MAKLRSEREVEEGPARDELWQARRQRRDSEIFIENLGGGAWRVSGVVLERLVIKTDWDNEEAVAYLQHRFERMGLDKALYKAGCRNGDEVRILGYALDYAGMESGEDEFAELREPEDDDEFITIGDILGDENDAAEGEPRAFEVFEAEGEDEAASLAQDGAREDVEA